VSVYPFVAALKADPGAPSAAIDTMVQAQAVFGTGAYGAGETNDASGTIPEALPIYTDLSLGGGTQRVCGSTKAGTYNKAGNRLFLKFSLVNAGNVTIRAEYTSLGSTAPFTPAADPDIKLHHGGLVVVAESTVVNVETLSRSLEPGDYVIEVYEFSHVDFADGAERRGVTCMNVNVSIS
jgi:hypothetical protein